MTEPQGDYMLRLELDEEKPACTALAFDGAGLLVDDPAEKSGFKALLHLEHQLSCG